MEAEFPPFEGDLRVQYPLAGASHDIDAHGLGYPYMDQMMPVGGQWYQPVPPDAYQPHHAPPRQISKKNKLDQKFSRKGYGADAKRIIEEETSTTNDSLHLSSKVYEVFGLPRVKPLAEQPPLPPTTHKWRAYLTKPESAANTGESEDIFHQEDYENNDLAFGPESEALKEF